MWFSRYVLTEVYQSLASSIYLNLLITGKNQLLTALPCWNGLTHSSSRTSPLSPPARTCLFYLKTLSSIFQIESGTHLLSHAVSSIVPSASWVLTIVFGMGTGVSPRRIATGKLVTNFLITKQYNQFPYLFLFLRKEVIQPHLPIRLPCYDFTPVTSPAFGSSLLSVESLTSGITDSHGVTGGVYKTRERIHRSILICDY